MAINPVLKNSGDIRSFLAKAMTEVRGGDLSTDKGATIAMLAKEINTNMLVEVKVMQTRINLNKAGYEMKEVVDYGRLVIDGDSTPALSGL